MNGDLKQMEKQDALVEARRRVLEIAQQHLEQVWQAVKLVPGPEREAALEATKTVWNMMTAMSAELQTYLMTIHQAEALIDAQTASIVELARQRDAVLDEMGRILKLDDSHPTVKVIRQEAYDQAAEDHNVAFWESLPYDIASSLGMEADDLYALLTLNPDDFDADDRGWTRLQVEEARAALKQIVTWLSEK